MTTPSAGAQPLPYDPSAWVHARDLNNLNLLALFHYIFGALSLLLSCLFIIHIGIGIAMLSGGMSGTAKAPGPPPELGWLFILGGGAALLIGWTIGILCIVSGRCLKARRRWTFSIVIAAVICLSVPLGTLLGVFTLIILLRDSVKELYGVGPQPIYSPPMPGPAGQ